MPTNALDAVAQSEDDLALEEVGDLLAGWRSGRAPQWPRGRSSILFGCWRGGVSQAEHLMIDELR